MEDTETIGACSLTSRTLSHITTKLKFQHLYLDYDNFTPILDELTASSHKATAVKRITSRAITLKDDKEHFCVATIRTLFPLLPNLEELIIVGCSVTNTTVSNPDNYAQYVADRSVYPSVTHLTLDGTRIRLIPALAFINIFPNLRALSLTGNSWNFPDPGQPAVLNWLVGSSTRPALRELTITDADAEAIAPYILPGDTLRQLEVVRFEGNIWIKDWWLLFSSDQVYDNLRHITVTSLSSWTGEFQTLEVYQRFSVLNLFTDSEDLLPRLPNTPNLRSLTLTDMQLTASNDWSQSVRFYVQHFLNSVVATSLEKLVFEFQHQAFAECTELRISEWLPLLSQDKFANVSKIMYYFEGHLDGETAEEIRSYVLDEHRGWERSDIVEVIVKEQVMDGESQVSVSIGVRYLTGFCRRIIVSLWT